MSNPKQDEREKNRQRLLDDIGLEYHEKDGYWYTFITGGGNPELEQETDIHQDFVDYMLDVVLTRYLPRTEATSAQERAVAEAVANDTDLLANRLYVALQEQHTMLMQTYGVSVSRPPTKEDAYLELAAPQNRGEG